ncbi:MAG: FAD-dependent oxidoreductase [Patescibacteria group bacterium]
MKQYLIIGGGIAGTTAAEDIRKRDPEGEITIIDAEQHPCYSRVLLSHYAKGKIERERLFLKKLNWYQEHNIELMSGVTAIKIDPQNKFVHTNEERELPYDKLLITTGGEVTLLPQDMRGISYLRTLDDTDHLCQLIKEQKNLPEGEQQTVVLGGGFIALEYVNIFAAHGILPIVVMRSGGFWSRTLSEHSQKVLLDHAQQSGLKVIANTPHNEILGDTEFIGLKLMNDQEVRGQILGVGIGLHFDISIIKDAGIKVGSGVLANEYLETNLPDIYTAGDIAEYNDVILGRTIQAGNWMSALMQARAVAKTMTGERTRFELVSSYSIDLLGLEIVFVGDTSRQSADSVIQHVSEENRSVELFIRDNCLVGAIMIGDVTERQKITDAIKAKKMLE